MNSPLDTRISLLANGFEPVPLEADKGCHLSKWQSMPINEVEVARWSNVARIATAAPATGVRTAVTPAFDVDLQPEHARLSAFIYQQLHDFFGSPLVRRRPNSPRFAVLLRKNEPIKKAVLYIEGNEVGADGKAVKSKVEFLGDGQQLRVFAPNDPNAIEYEAATPLDVAASELPLVTRDSRDAFFNALKGMLEEHGWHCSFTATNGSAAHEPMSQHDVSEAEMQQARIFAAFLIDEADERIEFAMSDDKRWVDVMGAFARTFGGSDEGFDLFHDLSLRAPNFAYEPEKWRARYNSFANQPGPLGFSVIEKLARDCGFEATEDERAVIHAARFEDSFGGLRDAFNAMNASVEERVYDRDEPALPPASDLITKLHDGWGREGVPVEPFLVEGLLSCRSGTVLAPGGEGKSTLVTLVAAHIILGRDLFGRPVQKPGAVLYVTGEDDPRDFSETLDRMVRAGWSLTDDERDTIHEGFDLIEGLKLPGAKLIVRDAHGALIPGPLLDVVREALDAARGRYSLVVFDTASTLGLPENEVGQDAAAAFHAYMTQVCREHGVASLLVHHTGKEAARSQLVDQYVGRGASALSDNARLVWQVVRDRGQGARRERAGAQVVEEPKYERPLGITEHDLTDGFTLRVHVHKLRWRPDGEGTDTPFWLVSRGWLPELYPPVPRQEARELRQARREAVDEAGRHSRRERLLSALRAAGEAGGSKNSLGLNGTSMAPGLAVLDELLTEGVVEVFETSRGTRWRLK